MRTVPNVSLVREASSPSVYLVVGDTKFWITDPQEFDALGFRWPKVLVVMDGTLDHLTEQRLHAAPRIRPSDVFYDCGEDFTSITGRWHYNCQPSASLIRRDVLVAGWLYNPDTPAAIQPPYVNRGPHGIEDVHYEIRLDAVFLNRMYGPGGLSNRLAGAIYPGNPVAGVGAALPFAAGPPLVDGRPTTVTFNSWILPGNNSDLHGELNSWHRYNTGVPFSRHFVGRGDPPARWVNPFGDDDGAYFPFDPMAPAGQVPPLRTGDYLVMRGPLWQDQWHGDPTAQQNEWDIGVTRHHAWLEMHPIDWIVRTRGPGPNARLTEGRARYCTPEATGPEVTSTVNITPEFTPSGRGRHLVVRSVERQDDLRPGMIVPAGLRGVQVDRQAERVDVRFTVAPTGNAQGRFKATWLVGWSEIDEQDRVWVDDALPAGADLDSDNESWQWGDEPPGPFHGMLAHRSAAVTGMHQHYFFAPATPMTVGAGDTLFSAVHLDPADPPDQLMLQWHTTGWRHRAFWGADLLPWGEPGTSERRSLGRLPVSGEWVRLEVPAETVGLGGAVVTGMAFTLFNGSASWDYAGVRRAVPKSGMLVATISPVTVTAGAHAVVVRSRDTGDESLVTGRVFLGATDIGATNTAITRHWNAARGEVEEVGLRVRCPGYPTEEVVLRVRGPLGPGDEP